MVIGLVTIIVWRGNLQPFVPQFDTAFWKIQADKFQGKPAIDVLPFKILSELAANDVLRLDPFFQANSFGTAFRRAEDRLEVVEGLHKAGLK